MKNDIQTLLQEFIDQIVTLNNQGKYLTLIERAQSLKIEYSGAFSATLDMVVSTKVTQLIISTSVVETLTRIADWRQSTFNYILANPVSLTLEMFNKNTDEPWNGVFKLKKGKL